MNRNTSNILQIGIFTILLFTLFIFFQDDIENKFFNKKEPQVATENIPAITPVENVTAPATSTESVTEAESVVQTEVVKAKASEVVVTPKLTMSQADLDAAVELKESLTFAEGVLKSCEAKASNATSCVYWSSLYRGTKECSVYQKADEIKNCFTQLEKFLFDQYEDPKKLFSDAFIGSLKSCTKYTTTFIHPMTKENLVKEILGVANKKCEYHEQMLNGGRMGCKFSESERIAVADYYVSLRTAKTVSSSMDISFGSGAQTNTERINGEAVENPLQTALTNGVCVISGY